MLSLIRKNLCNQRMKEIKQTYSSSYTISDRTG